MSSAHFAWFSTGSTDRPMTFTPRASKSGLILARYPSSVVQIGVKLRGCENRTVHESPIQSWKEIEPSVVSASKSGAVSPICRAISARSPLGRWGEVGTQPLFTVKFRVLPVARHDRGHQRRRRARAGASGPHAGGIGEIVGEAQRGEPQRVERGATSRPVGGGGDDERRGEEPPPAAGEEERGRV